MKEKKRNMEKENAVDVFLEDCRKIRSKNSRKAYRSHLNNYFKAIKKTPVGYISVDVRKLENGARIDVLDGYQSDVLAFSKHIEGRAPKSQVVMISVIKKFLSQFYLDLPQRFWDSLSVRGIPITEKRTPTPVQLKYILDGADIKRKSLFMMSCTSGLRIKELLSLKLNDIDMNNRSIRIRDETTKKGYSRTTFFTEEAKEYLKRWLDIRDDFIKNKNKRTVEENAKGYVEERVFPYGYHTARSFWINLLEKSGTPFNSKDNDSRLKHSQYVYNIHCLRRYFKTRMKGAGIGEEWLNYMVGHSPAMDKIYVADNQYAEQVKKQYDKFCNCLSVFSDAGKIKHEWGEKMTMQDRHIDRLARENEMLKAELDDVSRLVKSQFYKSMTEMDGDDADIRELTKEYDNLLREQSKKGRKSIPSTEHK